MASIKASSFLDGNSLPIMAVSSKSLLENQSIGKDFIIEIYHTATSFNSMSVQAVLTVEGNLEVINI